MKGRSAKVYVDVTVEFDADRRMYPRSLVWEDDMAYAINRVKTVRPRTRSGRAVRATAIPSW